MIHDQELIVDIRRPAATSDHYATEENMYVSTFWEISTLLFNPKIAYCLGSKMLTFLTKAYPWELFYLMLYELGNLKHSHWFGITALLYSDEMEHQEVPLNKVGT